jgi:hypothetical protein
LRDTTTSIALGTLKDTIYALDWPLGRLHKSGRSRLQV